MFTLTHELQKSELCFALFKLDFLMLMHSLLLVTSLAGAMMMIHVHLLNQNLVFTLQNYLPKKSSANP